MCELRLVRHRMLKRKIQRQFFFQYGSNPAEFISARRKAIILKWLTGHSAAGMHFTGINKNKLTGHSSICFAVAIKFICSFYYQFNYEMLMKMTCKTVMR